jgi:very-short-patch-repair endonuclease
MAAVLACGEGSVISHLSAAWLWGIRPNRPNSPELSLPAQHRPRVYGLRIHRRAALLPSELTRHRSIPVTSPALTIVDIAPQLSESQLEAAINEADVLDLIDPAQLRERLDHLPRIPGLAIVRHLLDRQTFLFTDSELERRFLRIVREASLPMPVTGSEVGGFKVDFHWPSLGLVVETDGLRYHRTPTQQSRDRLRDQAHARAGLTTLRFTHSQVRYEPGGVRDTLLAVVARLAGPGP